MTLDSVVRVTALLAILLGGLALLGWALNNPILESIDPAWSAMSPDTAVALILGGISLWLLGVPPISAWQRRVGRGLAVLMVLIAALTLADHLLRLNLGVDEILFRGVRGGAGMPPLTAPLTAAGLLLLGLALVLAVSRSEPVRGLGQALALISGITALVVLVGHAYGATLLYTSGTRQMALNTALALFCLSVGLLLAEREGGMAALFASPTLAGATLRRLLPAAIILPLVLGWLRLSGAHAGVYGLRVGLAVLVLANMGIFVSLVWWNALLLQRTDIRREAAEEESAQALAREQAARAEAEAASARFRGLVESAPDGIIIVDREGRITLANTQASKLFGYAEQELLGQPIETVVPERYRMMHVGYREEYTAAPRTRPMGVGLALFARRKDGSEFPVEISLSPLNTPQGVLITAIIRDITERKRAEEALRESEERFRLIVEAVRDYAIIMLDPQGRVTSWNTGAERTNGYHADEILGKHVSVFYPPEDVALGKPERELEVAAREGRFEDEGWRVRKDGSTFWANVVVTAIRDAGGELRGFAKITRDITSRKRAIEEIRKLNADLNRRAIDLEAANKELEAFSYSVSHDLRAPLRSIDGFSQALLEDYCDKLDPMGQDYLKRVRAASQRMGHLIDDILKLSRVIRAEMRHEPVDLSAIAQAAAAELQETQPERQVEWHIAPGVMAVGDPQLLRVVFDNLLGNALKFTGKVPNPCIEFGVTEQDGKPLYFIRDNGAGFDPTYKDKLFHAFQRLHGTSEFTGTGIGLATVQRIISRHGGQIRAESEGPGQGATFCFTLGA